jgi:hypothetical protein
MRLGITMLLGGLNIPAPLLAQECIDYADFLHHSLTKAWRVPVQAEDRASFVARDESEHLLGSETVTYTLLHRATDGRWTHLKEQTISMEAPRSETRLLRPYPNPFNPRVSIPNGRDVGTGLYVVRLQTSQGTQIKKLLMIK